jgi:plastocyanin
MKIAALFAGLCFALLATIFPLRVARAAEFEVEIVESGDRDTWRFEPAVLSVPAGSTVTWRNQGRQAHSVTSQDQLFDSKLLDTGKSWSYTFTTPGTYRYFCVPSPWLKGVVVVTSARTERDQDEEPDEPRGRPTATSEPTPRPTPTEEPTPRPNGNGRDEPTATPTPGETPTRSRTPTSGVNENASDD